MAPDSINKYIRSALALLYSIAFLIYLFAITFYKVTELQVMWVVLGYVSGLASGVASFYFGSNVIEAAHKGSESINPTTTTTTISPTDTLNDSMVDKQPTTTTTVTTPTTAIPITIPPIKS